MGKMRTRNNIYSSFLAATYIIHRLTLEYKQNKGHEEEEYGVMPVKVHTYFEWK
jgi:hypothetical protein